MNIKKKFSIKNVIFKLILIILIILLIRTRKDLYINKKQNMKTIKTYSIDETLYDAFDTLASEKNINKSSFFEDAIKKYLKENNLEIVGEDYRLKTNDAYIVTILSQNDKICNLSSGDKIQRRLFYDLFMPVDGVNPEEFFGSNNKVLEDVFNKVKKLNPDDVGDINCVPTNEFYSKDLFNVINTENKSDDIVSTIKESAEDVKELFKINYNYKSKEYLNCSKLEICDIIIKLKIMTFEYDNSSDNLRNLLVDIYTIYKDTLII